MFHFNETNVKSSDSTVNNFMQNLSISSFLEKEKILNSDFLNSSTKPAKPIPMAKEINLDPNLSIMSKTDPKGIIEFANDYFMEISGYEEWELMGQPHNIIRHPDMPKTIFKLLWDKLNKGENIHAFVKNMAKDGRYYWVLTNFEFKKDNEGNIISIYAKRKAAPRNVIFEIEKLYSILKAIENKQDMTTALNYFKGMLEEKTITYDQFILNILEVDQASLTQYFSAQKSVPQAAIEEKKRGFFGRAFSV
jgi:PAS domain S-box-containing protein